MAGILTGDGDSVRAMDFEQLRAQWDLRQRPPLYEAFAAVYGERDLDPY